MTFEYLLTSIRHGHYFHIKITAKLELKCTIIIIVVIAFISIIVEINYMLLLVSKSIFIKYDVKGFLFLQITLIHPSKLYHMVLWLLVFS